MSLYLAYNSTTGSVWIVILFHAVFNWLTANEAGGQFAAAFLSVADYLVGALHSETIWNGKRRTFRKTSSLKGRCLVVQR